MFLKIEVQGLEELKDELNGKLLKRLNTNLQDTVEKSGTLVETTAQKLAPHGSHSWFHETIRAEFPAPLKAEIGSEAKYAPFVELDTRPHWPPIEPLVEYAHLKLRKRYSIKTFGPRSYKEAAGAKEDTAEQVGFLLARKISRKGTKGQHVFLRAGTQTEAKIHGLFLKAVGSAVNG
ncbi:MAG TPA: hypothetical protein HA257_09340 [Candidatus Methanoperedenaceae archaeon]|nr:hypothetical protein [Candidatus Methanoperedenaceae archaeon]